MNNAVDLAKALAAPGAVDEALATWSARETEASQRLALLGQRLEKALTWSIPDFARMDEGATQAGWREAASLPEDMFPSR